MRARPAAAAYRWGVELGIGVNTLIVTPAFYALVGVAVAQPSASAACALCVIYGVVRGGVISLFAELNARQEVAGGGGLEVHVGSLRRSLQIPLVASIVIAGSLPLATTLGGTSG